MKYSYYPGCTLRNKAKDLDEYARASARALGFELEEIEDWQCCGGVYPLGTDEIATKLSSVRALNQAKEKGQDLVTICSACHHVIKRVNDDMKNVEDIRTRANNYLNLAEPYDGETKEIEGRAKGDAAYYKLRDLTNLIGAEMHWDKDTKHITIRLDEKEILLGKDLPERVPEIKDEATFPEKLAAFFMMQN